MSLHSEIHEQPACLTRLLGSQRTTVEEIAEAVKAEDIRFVYIAARGTSENAGRYATYLWGVMNHVPVALAAPSLFTYYNGPPRLRGALVVGISQSGRSPDIVSVMEEGKRQGCLTLAITNQVNSPLANAADFVLNIEAGDENAVAATKSYSAQLMAIAMLSCAIRGDNSQWQELLALPDLMQTVLNADDEIARIAQVYRSLSRCIVLARGFNYSTAYEWALKLKELTHVEAQPYSSAAFIHGPIAIVDGQFPIFAVVADGAVSAPTVELLRKLKQERQVEMFVLSNLPSALSIADSAIKLPANVPEWLSPVVAIIPAQLFTYHLAVRKGLDTESPRGIQKVTETR